MTGCLSSREPRIPLSKCANTHSSLVTDPNLTALPGCWIQGGKVASEQPTRPSLSAEVGSGAAGGARLRGSCRYGPCLGSAAHAAVYGCRRGRARCIQPAPWGALGRWSPASPPGISLGRGREATAGLFWDSQVLHPLPSPHPTALRTCRPKVRKGLSATAASPQNPAS